LPTPRHDAIRTAPAVAIVTSTHQKVISFIHRPDLAKFDELALEVFEYQFVSVSPYREYCQSLGRTPASVTSVDEIPRVSTAAFKYADLAPSGAAARAGSRTFLTSGTTVGLERRGRHVVEYPELYRASALAHLRRMMFADGARPRMLALHPTADRMPESSLSTMISWCIEEFGAGPAICAADRHRVDLDAALGFLREAEADAEPVCILATTAAAAAMLRRTADTGSSFVLAPGSRLMDTGGPKGQLDPLTPAEVIARAGVCLGIPPSHVINEYGMTELCSQLYDSTPLNGGDGAAVAERVKIAPAWMRPVAIDPRSFERAPDGRAGMLGFFDLANVCSVSAVVTEDLGFVEGTRVRLLGRAQAGGPRGCALAVEQFNSPAQGPARDEQAGQR
jgi:Acyl-protein synthetase, LuxE